MLIRPRDRVGFLYFLPALIVFAIFVGYPFLYTVYLSFRNFNWFTRKNLFNGLENYVILFQSSAFWAALGHTLLYTLLTLSGQVILAFSLALLLNKNFRGQYFFRSMYILPWILPTVVTALAWRMMLHERWGIIPFLLDILSITDGRAAFLAKPSTALVSVSMVSIWRGFPLLMVSFIASLQSIPNDMYEAAVIDGANGFQQLICITIPYIKKLVAIIVLFRTIWVFNDFDMIWLMTRGGPASSTETLPIFVYQRSFGAYKFGEAASIAMVMFLFLATLSSIYFKMIKQEEE